VNVVSGGALSGSWLVYQLDPSSPQHHTSDPPGAARFFQDFGTTGSSTNPPVITLDTNGNLGYSTIPLLAAPAPLVSGGNGTYTITFSYSDSQAMAYGIQSGEVQFEDAGGNFHCPVTWMGLTNSVTLDAGECTLSAPQITYPANPGTVTGLVTVTFTLTFPTGDTGAYTIQGMVTDMFGRNGPWAANLGTVVLGSAMYTISGQVMLAGGNAGLPGATVSLLNSAGTQIASMPSSSSGSYAFTAPAGAYTINTGKVGYSFNPGTWTGSVTSATSGVNFSGGVRAVGPLFRMPPLPSFCSNSAEAILNNSVAQELAFCIGYGSGASFVCNDEDNAANTSSFSVGGSNVMASLAGSPSQCAAGHPSTYDVNFTAAPTAAPTSRHESRLHRRVRASDAYGFKRASRLRHQPDYHATRGRRFWLDS